MIEITVGAVPKFITKKNMYDSFSCCAFQNVLQTSA